VRPADFVDVAIARAAEAAVEVGEEMWAVWDVREVVVVGREEA